MTKTIDYYLALNSPFAYLGGQRLAEMAARHRVEVQVKPVDFSVIFSKTGGLPLAQRPPARKAYRLVELERWSRHLGLPLVPQPRFFPAPEELAACFVLAAAETGGDPLRLANAVGRAVWVEERNIAEVGTLQDIAKETGHNRITLLAKAIEPTLRDRRRALTEEALAAGVFGAPSYLLDGELFWGQDRLEFLERALAR